LTSFLLRSGRTTPYLIVSAETTVSKNYKYPAIRTHVLFSAASEVLIIESALQTIAFVSCVKFEKWDGLKKDYIHFQPDKKRKG
jgi:hypothetical protein